MLFTTCYGKQTAFETATNLIKHHEGFKSKPYIDANHFSVGYGTNLLYGLSEAEASLLLTHRLAIIQEKLNKLHWYTKLSTVRKAVILDMTYNIGFTGILSFKEMIWCLKNNYYKAASNRMKDSKWYRQTKNRAKRLVQIMHTNKI